MRLSIVPAILILVPIAAVAQVYTWKDANGKTHYSDRPPAEAGVDARKMGSSTSPPAEASAGARKTFAETEAEARKRRQQSKEAAGKAEKDRTEREDKEKNCERAKAAVKAIESGETRFRINDKGEREALDGEAREAELAEARKSATGWCK